DPAARFSPLGESARGIHRGHRYARAHRHRRGGEPTFPRRRAGADRAPADPRGRHGGQRRRRVHQSERSRLVLVRADERAGGVGVRAVRVRVRRATVATSAAIVCAGAVAVGYTTTRVAADASPSGVAAAYPACAVDVLSRAPGAQRVFAAYATGGFVIDRLWPRATVYEYGESYALGATTFAGYYRIASGTRATPTALQLLEASHTSAVMYPASALTTELDHTPGWTRVVDDHGTLLYVRGKASWASGSACAASHAAAR